MDPQAVSVLGNEQVKTTHIIRLSKPEGFTHVPGQFVILQLTISGKPVRRSYSIASAPEDAYIELVVRRQEQGRASPAICDLALSDIVHVLGPYGQFVFAGKPLLLIGAGTGVTPYASFVRHLLQTGGSTQGTLLASHRTPEELLYKPFLQQAADLGIQVVHTITRPEESEVPWEGKIGRIDKQMLKEFLHNEHIVYVCGPTPMVVDTVQAIRELGVEKERIRTEKYGNVAS